MECGQFNLNDEYQMSLDDFFVSGHCQYATALHEQCRLSGRIREIFGGSPLLRLMRTIGISHTCGG
jgi:hypothetical protein